MSNEVDGRVVVAPAWTKGELWAARTAMSSTLWQPRSSVGRRDGREVVCLASSPEDDGQILQLSKATGGEVLPYWQAMSRIRQPSTSSPRPKWWSESGSMPASWLQRSRPRSSVSSIAPS